MLTAAAAAATKAKAVVIVETTNPIKQYKLLYTLHCHSPEAPLDESLRSPAITALQSAEAHSHRPLTPISPPTGSADALW